MTGCRYHLAAILLTFIASVACSDEPKLTKTEVAKRAKSTVAFVVAKVEIRPRVSGTLQGSAFCVHPSGLFVTNAHVVKGATEIELVLNPSEKNEAVFKASVVRTAETEDLAVLRVESKNPLPALSLGDDSALDQLTDVVACGYPFGSALAFGAKDYPSISTTAGAISSLRKKDGKLELIQLDVTLNPGNSGGPVLDMGGKVIGVAVGGIKGTQVNFAIPVRHVATLLAKPEFTFTAPTIGPTDRGKLIAVEARLVAFVQNADDAEVELEVHNGKVTTRHPMKPVNGMYRTTVVLLPERKGVERVSIAATFSDGTLVGSTLDREFKIGGTAHKLSEVRTIAPSRGEVVLRSNSQVTGKVAGLEAVPVALGGKDVIVDLSAAQELTLRMAGDEPMLVLEVVARRSGKELGRVSRTVLLDEANKVYLAELIPVASKPGPWPLAVGMNGSTEQNLPIKVSGQEYPKGLGLHANNPPATATYQLSRTASVFRTKVAFGDCNGGSVTGPTHFEVYGDGKQLWKSKAITTRGQTDDCLVDVSGVDLLELRVGHTTSGYGAHAVWLDPILIGPDIDTIRRAAGKK